MSPKYQDRRGSMFFVLLLDLTFDFLLVSPVTGLTNEGFLQTDTEALGRIWFCPNEFKLVPEGNTVHAVWLTNATKNVARVTATMEKEREAEVAGYSREATEGPVDIDRLFGDNNNTICQLANVTYHGIVNITAKFVGFNTLYVTLYDGQNETVAEGMMNMSIKLKTQELTTLFTYISAVLVALSYFFMGSTINLKVVKGIAKKPVGPLVGIFCQYVMMPLLSFGVGLGLFPNDTDDDRLMRLGMFLGGCCPGGGASNMWTHLLGGSLDLSIMMTGVSTFIAFGSVPLWVLTLGPVIINDASFIIPYVDITFTVISLIIPCGIGIIAQIKFPEGRLVRFCRKILSPAVAFNILVTFTFGIYAYLYVFTLFTWRMLVAGITLPTLGYLAGMLFACAFRMDTGRIIAIAVETGVQNYTIAVIILMLTLESPQGEIATAIPASFTLFTPVPLLLLLICRKTYLWHQGRTAEATPTTEVKETTKNGASGQDNLHMSTVQGVDNLAAEFNEKL